MDTVQFFSFETGHGEKDDLTAQQDTGEEDLSEEERSVMAVFCTNDY